MSRSETESTLTTELFHRNEISNNRLASFAVGILGILYCLTAVLSFLKLYDIANANIAWILLGNGLIAIILFLVSHHVKYDRKYLRSILIICITLSSAIVFFFYPFTAFFILYGPIIISGLYYDERLMRYIAIFDWSTFSVALWGNVYFEHTSEFIRNLHAYQISTIWESASDVMLYRFIPLTCTFIVTYLICRQIARNGKNMIIKNAEEISMHAVMDTEIAAASDLQRASLPASDFLDKERGVHVQCVMRPAKQVCGDFYDYFYIGSDIVVLIADVADKGLPAAMFMMKAKNAIRSELISGKKLEDAVFTINNTLVSENGENVFVTLWVADIDTDSGCGRYVNCGHTFPVICRKDGSFSVLKNEPDLVLGIFENTVYRSHPFFLSSDDTLFLYTDGLTDAVNQDGISFGNEGLSDLFASMTFHSEPCQRATEAIDIFTKGADQYDDMTLLSLCLQPGSAPQRDTITVSASYDGIETVINRVNAILIDKQCPEDIRRNIDVMIDEIATNITDYAYPDSKGDFTVAAEAGSNYISLTFTDSGVPFDPTQTDHTLDECDMSLGGLGITITKELADEMSYERKNEKNRLHIIKLWHSVC